MSQVEPHTHEASAYLNYAPDGDDYDGLDPYFAIASLAIEAFDGYTELEDVAIDGEAWDIRLNYSESGIAPRPTDDVDGETLYEFDITMRGPGEAKASFNLSPRYPSMRGPDGDSLSLPWQHVAADEGICVYVQASNVALDRFPGLLARAVFELADEADQGLYHGYFDAPISGRLTDIERYVRIQREMAEKLGGTGGVLDRLAMRLSAAEGTSGVYKFDNEDEVFHHHVVRHCSESAREMIGHHSLGGQIKLYLPENPDAFEPDEPLFHPKFATKFVQKRNDSGAIDWERRDDVVQELDERLLSLLSWGGVPTEAGGTTYVADDHFDGGPADQPVAIHADPLPQLEAQQEHLLMTCLRDMTPADEAIAETIATDGGQHVEEVAAETDTSLSTVYRCLQRLDGVLESANGHVQFVSEALREDVRGIVESAEHAIESAADRAAELVQMDLQQSASSAFDHWLKKYGAEVDWPDQEGGTPTVRLDTVLSKLKSFNGPHPDDVIAEMFSAWRKDGRNPLVLDGAEVEAVVQNEGRQTIVAMPE